MSGEPHDPRPTDSAVLIVAGILFDILNAFLVGLEPGRPRAGVVWC